MADLNDFFKYKMELLGTDSNGSIIIAHNIRNAQSPYLHA